MLVGAACGLTQASSSWQHHNSIKEAKREREAIERKLDEMHTDSMRRADLSDALLLDTTQDIKRLTLMKPPLLSHANEQSQGQGKLRIRKGKIIKKTD
jgi:hypothetical protein